MQPIRNGRGAPTLGRLLISHITLRGPELQQTYERIVAHGEMDHEELRAELMPGNNVRDSFGLDDAILREAINFLLVARLIQQVGDSRRTATFRAVPFIADVQFPLLLLNHITMLSDERQRAPTLIHRQLIGEDALSVTPANVRDRMERSQYANVFTWTSEKTTFWSQFAAYLGLARKLEREGNFLLIPQLSLVLEAIQHEMRQANTLTATVPLASILDAIDDHFFACYTRQRRIHSGLAQALVALHRLGYVRLNHESDAPRSLVLANRRVSHILLTES